MSQDSDFFSKVAEGLRAIRDAKLVKEQISQQRRMQFANDWGQKITSYLNQANVYLRDLGLQLALANPGAGSDGLSYSMVLRAHDQNGQPIQGSILKFQFISALSVIASTADNTMDVTIPMSDNVPDDFIRTVVGDYIKSEYKKMLT